MKFFLKILLIIILDFSIFWIWMKYENPDPSVSIALIVIVPFTIVINLIFVGIFQFLKNKEWRNVFILNIIFAWIIIYFTFTNAVENHWRKIWETWTFKISEKTYKILIHKPDQTFTIQESTEIGSSWSHQEGKVKKDNEKLILLTDSTKYTIKNDSLIGFTKKPIKMEKE